MKMATSILSLEEVLSQHGLKKKDLGSVCPRDVRNKVAVELVDWKMVGNCFNFSRAKLEAIDRENQTEDQRKVALLDAWGEREGKEASYLKLAEVLHQRGRSDLVQILCDKLKSNKDIGNIVAAAMDTPGRIKTLGRSEQQRLFQDLEELKRKEEDIKRLRMALKEEIFRKALLRISNQLSRQDLEYIKFLSEDDVPHSKMERVQSGTDLFNALEEHGKLSLKNLGFLVQVLTAINRTQLVETCLKNEGFVIPLSTLQFVGARGQISQQELQFMFRECLVKIAMGLQKAQVNDLTVLFQQILEISPDAVSSAIELFKLLMHCRILVLSDLRSLHEGLCQLQRYDLVCLINEYLARTGQQPYSADGQGMIIDHPGRTGNQNQTHVETGPARVHSDPNHGNLGAILPPQYYQAQASGAIGGSYLPHHHHVTGLSSVGTSVPSGIYRSNTAMDYPPTAGGVYTHNQPQVQQPRFHPEMMDASPSPSPTGVTALNNPPQAFGVQVILGHPLHIQHMGPLRHHSGDVKPVGFDFEFNKSNEPVSSPPFMQEIQQQKLLSDLSMKQGELVRKEEEIGRLRMALEEANSDKSKVYRERVKLHLTHVNELEELLRKKVEEVEFQMVETEKLRNALNFRDKASVYMMTSEPHGLAIIFINTRFEVNPHFPRLILKDRPEAQKDEEHFVSTFKFLGYTTVVYRNQKSVEMYAKMEELNNLDHSEYDSLVVCVSSHGHQNAIYGSDSVEVRRDEFYNSVKSCPSLKGKPKLFFIQANRLPIINVDDDTYMSCVPVQRNMISTMASAPLHPNKDGRIGKTIPVTTPLHPNAEMLTANASATSDNMACISPTKLQGNTTMASTPLHPNKDGQEGEATPMTTPLHPDADMLIVNASTPDNAAYITSYRGSWFVASLQRKLTDPVLIHSRTLSQLLVEVNGEVCQKLGRTRDSSETVTQCVEVTSRLRKEVTFFQK